MLNGDIYKSNRICVEVRKRDFVNEGRSHLMLETVLGIVVQISIACFKKYSKRLPVITTVMPKVLKQLTVETY